MTRSKRSGPRVLIYCETGAGLGHLRRATTISNALTAARPDASVLLVTNAPEAPFFPLRGQADVLLLPQIADGETDAFRPGRELRTQEVFSATRAGILRELTSSYKPDLFLVDRWPAGRTGELIPALEAMRCSGRSPKIVLGLRDVVDEARFIRDTGDAETMHYLIRRHYDRVLVFGSRDIFVIEEELRFPDDVRRRTTYCGYIYNPDPIEDAEACADLVADGRELAVCFGGGGPDAFAIQRTFIDTVRMLGSSRPLVGLVVTGPYMPATERRRLRDIARRAPVQVRRTIDDARAYFDAADVVVSMGGYNTLVEIVAAGARAVVVPRVGPSVEQHIRAHLFAQRGLVDVLEQTCLTASTMAGAIERALDPSRERARRALPLDGLERTTEALLELLP